MIDTTRRALFAALAGYALLATCVGGCAILKPKAMPDSIAACRQLSRDGVAAMERGEWSSAQQLLEEAVNTSPTDIDARRQLAEVLWQEGDRRGAAVQLETAVRLDPRHGPTLVRAGEVLPEEGVVDLATR